MTARVLDGQEARGSRSRRGARRRRCLSCQSRSRPRSRRRARRGRSGECHLHAQQGESLERGRNARASFTRCRPRRAKKTSAISSRLSTPTPPSTAFSSSSRFRRRLTAQSVLDRIDAEQGRRRLSPRQRRAPRERPCVGARALHPARLHAAPRARRREARWSERGRRRAEQHRRQADGAAPSRGERDGDHRALANTRPRGGVPSGRRPRRRRRSARR